MSVDPFQPPGAISSGPVLAPPVDVSRPLSMADPYAESVDLKQVFSSEEREALKRHRLTPGVAPWAFVALTILTFGLFGTIYHQLKQSKLPVVKHNDPDGGQGDRVSVDPRLQLVLVLCRVAAARGPDQLPVSAAGHPAPINRAHVVPAPALALFGCIVPIAAVAGCVWLLVLGANLQSAANRLATGRV